jgi:hypothetical protein
VADITVTLPDGSSIIFPAGTPPEKIKEVARRASAPKPQSDPAGTAEMNKQSERAMAQSLVDEHPVGARAAKFVQGVPFAGQYVDEGMGRLNEGADVRTRELQGAMDTARPVESAAWQLGGGIAGTVAASRGVAPVVGAIGMIPGLGLRTAVGLGAGALAGATEGAVSGYGAGNDGGRAASAGANALTGGAVGGVVGGLAPMVGSGVSALWGRLKGRDVAAIANELGITKGAAKAVKASLADGATGNALRRGGNDAMLLEANQATRDLGDAVAQSGGSAGRIMRDAVDERAAKGAQDFNQALNGSFGSATPRAKPDLGSVYQKAYSSPIDYSGEAGRNIEALVKRVPQSEFARARRLIEMDPNVPDDIKRQFLVSVQPNGTLKKDTLPSVIELDYVTRALNDVAKGGDGKGALGGNTNEGRIYGNLSKALRDQMKKAVPAYGRALDQASTEIGIKDASEFGATVLRQNVTRADVMERLAKAPKAEKDAAKDALRQSIDDTLANTRRIMSRPGTDVGEAMKGLRDLTTRAARAKLGTVLGRAEADTLMNKLDEAGTAFEIQAAMAGNSRTAVRQAVQGSIDKSTEPNVVSKVLAGEPVKAIKRLVQIFTGSTPEAKEAAKAGIYEEIANALTQTRGADAQRALVGIQRAMAGQALTDAQAEKIARITVTALTAGGYPVGTQAIQSQMPRMQMPEGR